MLVSSALGVLSALSFCVYACAPFSGADGSTADAAVGASSDAGGPTRFCAQLADAAFCADFDRPGVSVQDTFMSIDSDGSDANGAIALNAAAPLSPPNSALTTNPKSLLTADAFTAALETTITFTVVPKKIALEFAMHLGVCATDMSGNDRVATLFLGPDQWLGFAIGQGTVSFWIGHPAGGPEVAHTDLRNAPALAAGWVRVRMTVSVDPTTSTFSIDMTPAIDGGATVAVLSDAPLSDKVFPQNVGVHIGQEAVGPWGSCQIDFDDVVLTTE
jgi:hypothetical protein